jgi:hypothetical protein
MFNVELARGNALVHRHRYGGDDMKKPAPAHHRREPFLLTRKSDFAILERDRRQFPLHYVEINIRTFMGNSLRRS